jgi:hypothetical protein
MQKKKKENIFLLFSNSRHKTVRFYTHTFCERYNFEVLLGLYSKTLNPKIARNGNKYWKTYFVNVA